MSRTSWVQNWFISWSQSSLCLTRLSPSFCHFFILFYFWITFVLPLFFCDIACLISFTCNDSLSRFVFLLLIFLFFYLCYHLLYKCTEKGLLSEAGNILYLVKLEINNFWICLRFCFFFKRSTTYVLNISRWQSLIDAIWSPWSQSMEIFFTPISGLNVVVFLAWPIPTKRLS